MNSKLFKYLYKWKLDEDGKVYPQVKKVNIEWLPIPEINNIQAIVEHVDNIQNIYKAQEELAASFVKYVKRTLNSSELPSPIRNWHNLEFSDFINVLNKTVKQSSGKKMSKAEEIDWMEVFEKKKHEVDNLKSKATQIDKIIDDTVFDIYGLNTKEIEFIKASI